MSHQHDENGGKFYSTIVVGDELVTYRDYYCSCGKIARREIIDRISMK